MKSLEQHHKQMRLFTRIFWCMFVGTIVLILGIWITAGVFAYKTITTVDEKRLKAIATQLYCGRQQPDCMSPSTLESKDANSSNGQR